MLQVPSRDARTLLLLLQIHLRSGTIVHSNECSAYSQAQQLPYVCKHEVVNHSLNFVDPTTGVHTQHIESYWNQVKTKFKRMKGVHTTMVDIHLDEFMWRERHGQTASMALHNLCRHIADHYPQ